MPPIITVDRLGKQYRLGTSGTNAFRYRTLRETLVSAADRARVGGAAAASSSRHVWALRDVSFSVEPGEVLGLIGRNGAGKSTLLKILSRLTKPTEGEAVLKGRVGSLLEVATGFHPELTGRDNVYLSGAILGMKRAEIARKFDAIVDFSGVSAFIDTPVKRYSSGMYVRLAFAVAAHLEPEILLIDEVLAVGDAAFQRQCLGKMQDVSQSGRTIVFVSHNMQAVSRLCGRGILLAAGRNAADGPIAGVIGQYLSTELGATALREWATWDESPGNDWIRIRAVRVVDEAGAPIESVDVRVSVGVQIEFETIEQRDPIMPGITLTNELSSPVFTAFNTDRAWREALKPGRYQTTAWIPPNLLNEGTTIVSAALGTLVSGRSVRQAVANDAVAFHVVDPGEGDTARGDYTGTWTAPVRPLLHWTTVTLA
jgi:lipopolysaccharide transport system ATP-binding protein